MLLLLLACPAPPEGEDSAGPADTAHDSGIAAEQVSAASAVAKLDSPSSNANFGGWLSVGELDGAPAILVGAQHAKVGETGSGAAFLYRSAFESGAEPAAELYSSTGGDVGSGTAFPGDLDGDGVDDVLVGSRSWTGSDPRGAGAAYVLPGPFSGKLDMATAGFRLLGTDVDDLFGVAVSGSEDFTGDGEIDFAVGARRGAEGADDAGSAYLFAGPVGEDLKPSNAHLSLFGSARGGGLGRALDARGDLDGDGLTDLAAGAYLANVNAAYGGAAYVVHGGHIGTVNADQADAQIGDDHERSSFGRALVSHEDINGDGLPDLLVGAAGTGDGQAGAVYGYTLPEGSLDTRAAFVMINAANDGDWGGYALAAGDLDANGEADLAIGRPGDHGDNENTTLPGVVCVIFEPKGGAIDRCDREYVGESPGDSLGIAVDIGQLDGVGPSELVIGAYGADAVYLF